MTVTLPEALAFREHVMTALSPPEVSHSPFTTMSVETVTHYSPRSILFMCKKYPTSVNILLPGNSQKCCFLTPSPPNDYPTRCPPLREPQASLRPRPSGNTPSQILTHFPRPKPGQMLHLNCKNNARGVLHFFFLLITCRISPR